MLILNVKISGETVSISYENNKVLEIEILLKTYIEFPFYSNQEIDEIIFFYHFFKDDFIYFLITIKWKFYISFK